MHKHIKFIDIKSDVPIVRFMLHDGAEGYAIVDSGSEITSFDTEFINNHKDQVTVHKTESKMNIVGLNDNISTPVTKLDAAIMFSSDGISKVHIKDAMIYRLDVINFNLRLTYKTDIKISAIIGSDVLSKIRAVLDYQNKELILNDDLLS